MRIAVILLTVCLIVLLNISLSETTKQHAEHAALAAKLAKAKKGSHHKSHKALNKSGRDSGYHASAGKKGHTTDEHRVIDDAESGGKKKKYHSKDNYDEHHSEHGGGGHYAKFKEGAGHHKDNFKKGFMEKYHKNEKKKHDSYYSKGEKAGDFKLFGSKNSNFQSHKFDKVEGGNHDSSKSSDKYGKSGKKQISHDDKWGDQYEKDGGGKSHHSRHDSYAKKGNHEKKSTFNFDHKK